MFFGSKKQAENKDVPAPQETPGGGISSSPEKAQRFFDHARTVYETGGYEYAVQSWLTGIGWDPHSVTGLEGLAKAMGAVLQETGGKKGLSKDVAKSIAGKTDVDRYRLALLDWMQKPEDATLGVRALEIAAKAQLIEPAAWIGPRALTWILRDKKPRKDLLLKVADCFSKIGAFDKALLAAEQAMKLDPSDGPVAAYVRELAAQVTMTRGGYDKTGEQGGFRQNIRDADKQRQLDEGDRIVKTEETLDRLITNAEQEVVSRPGDIPTVEKLCKLLIERGRPADEERAHTLYTDMHKQHSQFRFRELAGDIRIRQTRRKAFELRKMIEKSPGDEMLQRMLAQADEDIVRLEVNEFRLRVQAYPTDLNRKFELGKRCFQIGEYHEAITLLQEAQSDPKNRGAAMNALGHSFLKIDWLDEAIGTFRQALDLKDLMSDLMLELRYGLMLSLQSKAEAERDLESISEADKLASSIAVQQITYKDIRQRRDAIKKLLVELRQAKST